MKKFSKGFTLIELLVVIAIIGILSSVVLASLNTARGKGADAAIKANLANIRAQAEIYYDSNSSTYGTQATSTATATCVAGAGVFSDATVRNALQSAATASGGAVTCGASPTYWAASIPLKTNSAQSWCVDSTGASKERTGPVASAGC
ncbi:MAG: type II secretion system protein [Candidatus Paceibacterota bacterium]|jgi:prepilin-type N-terminal cleavage/methylation domain-containing protein